MYKVFIENQPLFFCKDEKELSTNTLLYKGELNSEFISLVKRQYKKNNGLILIAVISKSPLATLKNLFTDFKWVEAAGGIVKHLDKEKYLFIKRNGFWDIPKGKVEKGESFKTAAKREIIEECGIEKISLTQKICETYHIYDTYGEDAIKRTHWYSFNSRDNKKLKGQQEEGISKVKWMKKKDLSKIRKNTFGSIQDVLDLYFID